ncbi:Probable RNA-directed DNA polymerase from transposon BS [Eumeta japonica]|uniref:Probable RNA-directed DNA polymerase from transposon BS n=1 Tax=Eumeta variegata TaxID=151549 RepID=A0A4C1U7I5_EUMVA|nr:Probable RNA-directed DNA polymerase from transposon BS [Eumeta japonica]
MALLVAIFNECFKNCYFIPSWKEAVGIGVPKSGKPRNLQANQPSERVWQAGLIHTLYTLGVADRLILIIHNYINNGEFTFRHENTYSSKRLIKARVPRGSTLSPLLYLAYTNDIPRPQTGDHVALFVDDTTFYFRSFSVGHIIRAFSRPLTS